MAKQHSDGLIEAGYLADTDLTNACALYRFVAAASTANRVKAAIGGSNPAPLGVLYSTGSAGQAVSVKTLGHTILTGRNAGCNLDIGDIIVCASDGVAQSASAVGEADGIGYGFWLGPAITSGSAYGEAHLWGTGASILART